MDSLNGIIERIVYIPEYVKNNLYIPEHCNLYIQLRDKNGKGIQESMKTQPVLFTACGKLTGICMDSLIKGKHIYVYFVYTIKHHKEPVYNSNDGIKLVNRKGNEILTERVSFLISKILKSDEELQDFTECGENAQVIKVFNCSTKLTNEMYSYI